MTERVVTMGVTGSGKSTIGRLLAARLDAPFVDADDLHSADAITKMHAGRALTDADREPWLQRVHAALGTFGDGSFVAACSALKRSYRDALRAGLSPLTFVLLDVDPTVLAARLGTRTGHFASASLLPSQRAALEVSDDLVRVDASGPPPSIVDAVLRAIR
jgi:carbohydrate kinase (thermoresistant glucokinase family)